MRKVELNADEIKILLECVYALNFRGADVEKVGLLAYKLRTELDKIQTSKGTNQDEQRK
jgi:hypothetical protein